MTFTKIAVVGGVALLAFVSWLAASGFGAAREGLISLVALVVLVGGGNLLAGRSGHYGRGAVRVPQGQDPAAESEVRHAGPDDEPAP
ncbi:MAG TPA: hypothetical protein VND62_02410 [Acidimicrobiales bacterium]|nr:hypothetical protein [Acidimicrobiales bacterium]